MSVAALRERVAAIEWYHTLELAPGVATPGYFDHRPTLARVPLPPRLDGLRCLDVGTFNGFWAFEMERRGAAEVHAVDVLDAALWDWPVGSAAATRAALARRLADGDGFVLAREALGSRVERHDLSVYDLDSDRLGRFDIVYLGSLLVHLRDPIRALERVRAVCRGSLVLVDAIDLPLTLRSPRLPLGRLDGRGRPWWWTVNLAGLVRAVEAAGFALQGPAQTLFLTPGKGWPQSRRKLARLRFREGRYQAIVAWLGDPHGALVARPRAEPA